MCIELHAFAPLETSMRVIQRHASRESMLSPVVAIYISSYLLLPYIASQHCVGVYVSAEYFLNLR
jgi:hypothetical protein